METEDQSPSDQEVECPYWASVNPVRKVVDGALSHDECQRLIHIQRSSSVPGYIPRFSVTLLKELLSNPHTHEDALFLLRTREKLRDLVETAFQRECELLFEFTGLKCWYPGASLNFHNDRNRPYTRQRHYSIVCFLNDGGVDFKGADFCFRSSSLSTPETPPPLSKTANETPVEVITPRAGRAVLFSSGAENEHCVTPIVDGLRYTLIMWLTMDPNFVEDDALLARLLSDKPSSSPSHCAGDSAMDVCNDEDPRHSSTAYGNNDFNDQGRSHDTDGAEKTEADAPSSYQYLTANDMAQLDPSTRSLDAVNRATWKDLTGDLSQHVLPRKNGDDDDDPCLLLTEHTESMLGLSPWHEGGIDDGGDTLGAGVRSMSRSERLHFASYARCRQGAPVPLRMSDESDAQDGGKELLQRPMQDVGTLVGFLQEWKERCEHGRKTLASALWKWEEEKALCSVDE
eukprot:TRINITY_DN240_c0_g1_i2.p1 TRINITY_DN240_c0_g1~~TRINITY_DN240_c0_g1_i2.p1  ORF type:complete len:458 (+),score=70.82 TRINITY_DN240_c0_g1_i2:250-1623(+)